MTVPHPVLRPQPGILGIAAYVGGESALPGANRVLKLSSNENPLGPSPLAVAAYRAAADRLALYPDPSHGGLRTAIGEVHGLDPARIVCGAGSDELLTLLAQAYAGPGDEVIHTSHGFSIYRIAAQAAGATPVEVAEHERVVDVDAILAACTDRTRLVYVANPANPTGTRLPDAEVARLAAGLPAKALLVLDGAYAEYVREPGFDAGRALVGARENVVMTRTFSKIHGLAALRVGWAYGPPHVVDVLSRIRGPFNLSSPALAAAEAAVRDRDWTERCSIENEVWRDWLVKALGRAGVPCDGPEANFVLARFADAHTALACDGALRGRGILVRRVGGYGLPAALRITVGDADGCQRVAAAIGDFMGARA